MADPTRLMLPFEAEELSLPETGTIVALRAQPGLYGEMPRDQLHCVQSFFPTAQAVLAQGLTCTATPPDTADMVIVHLTRSREENRANVAIGYDLLPVGGQMIVDGAKTDGIAPQLKAVKGVADVAGQHSKAHGKVFWFTKSNTTNPFADWKAPLIPTQNADGWTTAAGMFSADGIDPGSAELIAHLPEKLKGKGADLGAGWGWLSAQILSAYPAITQLDLIEAEATALDCARQNVTDPRATFQWADATKPAQKGGYDFVISNPPFHTGRTTDPDLGRAFIQAAAHMLSPNGQFLLVANRQLAYESTLNACFARTEVLHQSSRYKVIHARKPLAR